MRVRVLSDEIRMDMQTFESLASETRIAILKLLDQRQMTVTEISRHLNLAKSTVHEHLAKMLESGLVEKIEDHRKWTYYRLTYKAKRILHPSEMVKIMVLLGISFLALIGGILEVGIYRHATGQMMAQEGSASEALSSEMMEKASPMVVHPNYTNLFLGVILIGVSLLLGYMAFKRWNAFRP